MLVGGSNVKQNDVDVIVSRDKLRGSVDTITMKRITSNEYENIRIYVETYLLEEFELEQMD